MVASKRCILFVGMRSFFDPTHFIFVSQSCIKIHEEVRPVSVTLLHIGHKGRSFLFHSGQVKMHGMHLCTSARNATCRGIRNLHRSDCFNKIYEMNKSKLIDQELIRKVLFVFKWYKRSSYQSTSREHICKCCDGVQMSNDLKYYRLYTSEIADIFLTLFRGPTYIIHILIIINNYFSAAGKSAKFERILLVEWNHNRESSPKPSEV